GFALLRMPFGFALPPGQGGEVRHWASGTMLTIGTNGTVRTQQPNLSADRRVPDSIDRGADATAVGLDVFHADAPISSMLSYKVDGEEPNRRLVIQWDASGHDDRENSRRRTLGSTQAVFRAV